MKFNERGFSLVEIMVAVGLLGALTFGLMKITSMQSKQSKKSEQMLDGFQIFSTIGMTLLNSSACRLTMQTTVLNAASVNVGGGAIKNSAGQAIVTVGVRVGSVRVDNLRILSPVGGIAANSIGLVQFEVVLTKIGHGGVDEKQVSKQFPLNVSVDGAQTVVGCYSALDNAIESARELSCTDLGGVYNASAVPVCQLGNLSILGTFTTPSTVNAGVINTGSAVVSGAVQANSFQYTSDRRFKENVNEVDSALASLMDLRPVHFSWKQKNKTNKNKQDIGFIAQEIEEVFPDVVYDNPDRKTVDYIRLTPYLVKAIQEQQLEINELKAQLNKQQGKKRR